MAKNIKNQQGLLAWGNRLADARIFFYALIWLMILLFVGTIAQKYIGLYQAQSQFFSSFVTWFWIVPVPGGYAVMGVVFVNLLCKLLFQSPWTAKNMGNIITHIGALLLLLGGFLTAAFSYEGNMVIFEGETANFISDYNERELVIEDKSGNVLMHWSENELEWRREKSYSNGLVNVTIGDYCRHCSMRLSDDGMQKMIGFKHLEPRVEDEENISGAELLLLVEGQKKILLVHERITDPLQITVKGVEYNVVMRRKKVAMPFTIELVDFEKQIHPGTNKPRAYKSDIIVIDGNVTWPATISMNQPLRYKGYTLFQASFLDDGKRQATVFAVVHNVGRLFPYIASIVMCIGLLMHLVIRMPTLFKQRGEK